jgi:hypothetical protein
MDGMASSHGTVNAGTGVPCVAEMPNQCERRKTRERKKGVETKEDNEGVKYSKMTVPEVRELLQFLLETRQWDAAEVLLWSKWRRQRNYRAAESHRKRRAAQDRQRQRQRASHRKTDQKPPSAVP